MPRAQTVDTSSNEGSKTMGRGFLRPSLFFFSRIGLVAPCFLSASLWSPPALSWRHQGSLGGLRVPPGTLPTNTQGATGCLALRSPAISLIITWDLCPPPPCPWSPAVTGVLINIRPFHLNQNGNIRTALFICISASGYVYRF